MIDRVNHLRTPDTGLLAKQVENHFNRGVREQFDTEGQRFDTPWKPLQPDYRLWKIQHNYSGDILVKTGWMRHMAPQGNCMVERTPLGLTITYQTGRDWLIPVHHYGVEPWLPARPILNVTPSDLHAIASFVKDAYLRAF